MRSHDILGPQGPFIDLLEGFVVRPSQQELADSIESALIDPSIFIAESGTGTGKTFAYLVPALKSGKKVLISTGTRNLQDQLYRRDIPLVRKALRVPVNVALLKGRANYLCLYRLERALDAGHAGGRSMAADLAAIQKWAGRTTDGDISAAGSVPESSDVRPLVTSTADNCLGGKCPRYNDCFVNRARREALAADVLVVNHHLFFADMVLKEEGFGQLLPGAEAVIFDEAHQLPDIASLFFGLSLSSHQLNGLCRDVLTEEGAEHSGVAGLPAAVKALETSVAGFRLALGVESTRAAMFRLDNNADYSAARRELSKHLNHLLSLLDIASARGEGLADCHRRASGLCDRLEMLTCQESEESISWYETSGRSFTLRMTPLDTAPAFREQLAVNAKTWIFTSATLAIKGDFRHFSSKLGLDHAETGLWDSPFDYARQTLLYLPRDMPAPLSPEYTGAVIDRILPVLQASHGRAFILFTSHRALNSAAEMLRERIDFPLLVQGSMPRPELLERFRTCGNAVLLGTGSFWEGVDVRGPALSCVVIDKLPFAAPDDPVLRARAAAMEQAGRNPFMELQLPDAVIALKQGAGRLIRDTRDRGVLILCDPRLLSKNYGGIFLASLPPMPRTRELDDVRAFFKALDDESAAGMADNAVLS